jgi:LacI family transcriptional regulator
MTGPTELSAHALLAELEAQVAATRDLPAEVSDDEYPAPAANGVLSVGLVLAPGGPGPEHPYWQPVVDAARERLHASACSLTTMSLFARGDESNPLRRSFAEIALERGLDGVLVAALSPHDSEIAPLLDAGIPVMFVDAREARGRAGCVTSNGAAGMEAVVAHLVARGRTRIAHVAGFLRDDPAVEREEGFRRGVERAGLACPAAYVDGGDWLHGAGYEAARRLLALPQPPDAITTASDFLAVGVLAALAEAGVRVPDDIAVAGFDDSPLCLRTTPTLTSVRQDPWWIGRVAAEGLLQMIERPERPPVTAIVPVELVVRDST